MPTYGYLCTECGHEFELFQRVTDPPAKECEQCGGKVQKQVHAVGIAFKGSGFHVNDYAPSRNSAPTCEFGSCGGAGDSGRPACVSDSG